MKTATFTNFTKEDFTAYWNGRGRTVKAGKSKLMPEYLARHYAKHLVNRELLRRNAKGNLKYPHGEKMTSPKKPEDYPVFMELFNKAFEFEEDDELEVSENIDVVMKIKEQQTEEFENKPKE